MATSIRDLGQVATHIAGSALLGVTVGHLGNMFMPSFDISPKSLQGTDLNASNAMVLAKAAVNAFSRLIVEVGVLATGSELFLDGVRDVDPTNGGAAIISLMMSDPKLRHDFRVLNSIIHAMIGNGIGLKTIEKLFEAEEMKIAESMTARLGLAAIGL